MLSKKSSDKIFIVILLACRPNISSIHSHMYYFHSNEVFKKANREKQKNSVVFSSAVYYLHVTGKMYMF